MINRDSYLQKLIDYKDKDLIKIITGIRRCGKSVLLFDLFYDYLLNSGVKKKNIIKINLEDLENVELRDNIKLYKYIKNKIDKRDKNYVLIDEIQYVDNFEDLLNSIKNMGCDVYVTGSNSKLLSNDINTALRGRGIEIKVYPLSFKEFYSTQQDNENKDKIFEKYITYGGMPYITSFEKDYEKREYLKMLNDTVSFKDIIDRNRIKNIMMFNSVIEVLYSSIGSFVSANSIANTLKSNGYKSADNETISTYLNYLCDAFLFYKVQRFDIKGKSYLKTLNKYYATDLGLRNEKLNFRQIELTHILENIVYLELIRRNYSVDIGVNNQKEIDFVARKFDELLYIQVCLTLENTETKQRELSSFKGIDDGFKKIIITKDYSPLTVTEKGYKLVNIYDFLLYDVV